MILQVLFVAELLSAGLVLGVPLSYSTVHFVRGPDMLPVGYEYGVPSYPQYSLVSSPYSEVSEPVIAQGELCLQPCGQQISAVQSVPSIPNQRLVAVNSLGRIVSEEAVRPVLEGPARYEYSYLVYDESTGDHKSQQEQSENGVVRGSYSLIQPDGYVREVKYTADDLHGFNAVVKNFLPAPNTEKAEIKIEVKEPTVALGDEEIIEHIIIHQAEIEKSKEETSKEEKTEASGEKKASAEKEGSKEMEDEPMEELQKEEEKLEEEIKEEEEEILKEEEEIKTEEKDVQQKLIKLLADEELLRCIQAAAHGQLSTETKELITTGASPLTYVLLPQTYYAPYVKK